MRQRISCRFTGNTLRRYTHEEVRKAGLGEERADHHVFVIEASGKPAGAACWSWSKLRQGLGPGTLSPCIGRKMAEGHPLGWDASLGRAVSCSREQVPGRDAAMSHQELTPRHGGRQPWRRGRELEKRHGVRRSPLRMLQGSSQ